MPRGYKFFDHTADVGALVRGATLPRLFENASLALFDLLCDRRTVRPRRRVLLHVAGSGLDDLLVRWLSELLFRHGTEGWVFSSFKVEKVDRARCRVRGVARGEMLDRPGHALRREVKAVTYHQLRIERARGAWSVRIIFDV